MIRSSFAILSCALVATLSIAGCAWAPSHRGSLADEVDASCGGPAWRDRHALAASLTVHRVDRPDVRGRMFYDVRGNRLTLQFPSASGGLISCGFDGQSLWIDSPPDADCGDWPTMLQWASWVAVPYRLTEPELRVREMQTVAIAGITYRVAELERPGRDNGSCALFVDRATLTPRGGVPLRPAGCGSGICPPTFGFAYDEFYDRENILIPTRWSVWSWDPRTGISPAGPNASIVLDNPQFVEPDPSIFESPRDDSIRRNARRITQEG